MAKDEEWLYCVVCRRNHTDGRRQHQFRPRHVTQLRAQLDKEAAKLARLREGYLHPPIPVGLTLSSGPDKQNRKQSTAKSEPERGQKLWQEHAQIDMWCLFCAAQIDPAALPRGWSQLRILGAETAPGTSGNAYAAAETESTTQFVGAHIFYHLSTDEHNQAVIRFWTETGVPNALKKHKMHHIKADFCLTSTQFSEYQREASSIAQKLRSKDEQSEKEPEPIRATDDRATMAEKNDASVEKEAEAPVVYKTLINQYGVKQNPTGWDGNERVWGGGIIKYKKLEDWIPWKIDLDDESNDSKTGYMGANPVASSNRSDLATSTNAKEEGEAIDFFADDHGDDPSAKMKTLKSKSDRSVSEMPVQRLTRIAIPNVENAKGNVHTGAVPPWMRMDESEEDPATFGPSVSSFLLAKRAERQKKLNPKRVGANFNPDASQQNWLPNFGRVWSFGPRRETKEEFWREQQSTGDSSKSN